MPTIQKTIRIYDFIKRYHASNNEPPTMAEIGQHFHLRSLASVSDHLKKMEDRGWITRIPNISRGIRIVDHAMIKAA